MGEEDPLHVLVQEFQVDGDGVSPLGSGTRRREGSWG